MPKVARSHKLVDAGAGAQPHVCNFIAYGLNDYTILHVGSMVREWGQGEEQMIVNPNQGRFSPAADRLT